MKKRKLGHGMFLLEILALGIEFCQDVRRNAYRMELEKSYLERKRQERNPEENSELGLAILECSCGYMASTKTGVTECPECGQPLKPGAI